MRGWKKSISLVTAAALFLTALPAGGPVKVRASGKEADADVNVKLNPADASPFNDTDGDGFGEFEGWGTSLCWWANRLGYDETLTQEAARVFFSDEGLDMNIGRYNVGGGDHVVDSGIKIYGLEGANKPAYEGKGEISTVNKLNGAAYTVSDSDFGITQGDNIENNSIQSIGWINELGATKGDGDNLVYTVNVTETGIYTIKMLWTLDGENKRAAAIRINGDKSTDQVVSAETINKNLIASKDNANLFLVTFPEVALKEGNNTIAIGGNAAQSLGGQESWAMDFVKMLVRPKDRTVPADDEFAHAPHIQRSDSVVPGYCTDVTKIDLSAHDISYYEENFARADGDCGYAWNYDWNADANQMNILKAAMEASGEDFIAEAFSNSPPYFMTYSGCSSGAVDSSKNNLRSDSYDAFAAYMADVIVHWAQEGTVNFQSATPMNEPDTAYWGANSNKQEGCHFDPGAAQSRVIVALKKELEAQAKDMEAGAAKTAIENIILSGTDETDIDKAITSYNSLTAQAKETISRIDTHTYSGSKRTELSKLAKSAGKNLWMSEVDGAYAAGGENAGEMKAALGLAQRIMTDLKGLRSSAWILWNAVDMNVDAENEWDKDDLEALGWNEMKNKGYWGIAIGDHNNKEIVLTKKYDAFGQFSRYIRPGYSLIDSDNDNTLAAYDPKGHQAVIVAMNTSDTDQTWKFDLTKFMSMDENIEAYRTCTGERWEDVSMATVTPNEDNTFTANMAANSITTYVISDVTYDRDKAEADEKAEEAAKAEQEAEAALERKLGMELGAALEGDLEELELNTDMVTGSDPWNNDSSNAAANVVDGKIDTYFDGVADGWVQIDLGNKQKIAVIDYAPRSDGTNGEYAKRCVDASFYGSNDGTTWEKLYTIAEAPAINDYTRVYATLFNDKKPEYRYIKYAVPEGDSKANCNIAEIKLYTLKDSAVFPDYPDTLEKLVSYCKTMTEGKSYSETSQKKYDTAMAEGEQVIADKGSDEAKRAARKKLLAAYFGLSTSYSSFTGVNGDAMYDTEGKLIQAHGGQIQQFEVNGKKKWYWIGEDKTNDYRPCPGIHMYSSDDLYNWDDEGVVLKTAKTYEEFLTDKYFTDLYGDLETEEDRKRIFTDIWQGESSDEGCVIERPKMLYNDKTGKYVIWFHADGQDPFSSGGGNYAKAKAGVAIADSPAGPYKLLGSYLLNYQEGADHGFDGDVGGHVRDMNLFKDDDGTAYVMYSSDGNKTMHIARLNEEYTNVAQPDNSKAVEGVDFTRNFVGESREGPAMFKYRNKYYMITSGCTGWNPNRAGYAVADHPMGPWTMVGDPCTDEESNTTYHTQSTCVFPVDAAAGKFIYMGDRWKNSEVPENGPGTLKDSRYVWLPVEFIADGEIALRRYSDWTLEDLNNKGIAEIVTELPKVVKTAGELGTVLPDVIQIKSESGEVQDVDVSWQFPDSLPWNAMGTVKLTGIMQEGQKGTRKFTHTVSIVNEKTIYFFDSGAEESAYLETVRELVGEKLRNQKADQAYTPETQAGFAGIMDTDVGIKSVGSDIWEQGYYAKGDKNIEYSFDLEAGAYTAATGYQEWWNTARGTKIAVLTEGEEGETELASMEFTLGATDDNHQEALRFRLKEPGKVTVRISKTGSSDPVLSWIAIVQNSQAGDDLADKAQLEQALEKAKELEKKDYTSASWKEFQNLYQELEKEIISLKNDPAATQAEADELLKELERALSLLVENKTVLEKGIAEHLIPDSEKSKYTAESWKIYADALKEARNLLEQKEITEKAVERVLKSLSDAEEILESKNEETKNEETKKPENQTESGGSLTEGNQKAGQTIQYTKEYKITYGAKPFSLNARVTAGNGALKYKSSNKKVAAVSSQGKVTVKDIGVSTISITASATGCYKAKTVKVTVKVVPKKVSLTSVKTVKGKKLSVKWKKDAKVTGFQVQRSLKKDFKSGIRTFRTTGKKNSAVIKKLQAGKKYYVRVRAYKVVKQNGKLVVLTGEWSNVKVSGKVKK